MEVTTIGIDFTDQAVIEFAPDGHTCTLPGGVAGAGTEFALVGNKAVVRFTATRDLLFFKGTSATVCQDFSTPPSRSSPPPPGQGSLLAARENISERQEPLH
jgi:hypothetical protein